MELLIIILYILSSASYIAYFCIQKNYLQKIGYYILLVGFLCHMIGIGYGYLKVGHLPTGSLKETLSIAGCAVTGVFLLLRYKFSLKILGVYAAPLSACIMIVAFRLPSLEHEMGTLFNSPWLVFHVVTIFIGEASLALACGTGILYLAQENAIKTKNHGFFYKRLPSLDLLDSTGYACIIVGFSLLTIGLITGFVYAKSVWGKFWTWDNKEVWSVFSWLLYAVLLHQRLAVGWRGRRSAIMAIIGFIVLIFTFLGVNFLLKGHHGQFTAW